MDNSVRPNRRYCMIWVINYRGATMLTKITKSSKRFVVFRFSLGDRDGPFDYSKRSGEAFVAWYYSPAKVAKQMLRALLVPTFSIN